MAIMFPTLGKKKVHIGIGDGNWIEVSMLPVADYDRFREIQLDISNLPEGDTQEEKTKRVETVNSARNELLALAEKVMPEELHDHVRRLDYMKLTALVLALCTGDDDSEEDDPEKKITLPSQMENKSA
jgi:hypothetical protein